MRTNRDNKIPLSFFLIGSVLFSGCKKTVSEETNHAEKPPVAQSYQPNQPGSDSQTPWDDINDNTNRIPTAKDAYIEPEKDIKMLIDLNSFLAKDGDGDALTIAPLDENKVAVDRYQDRFTVVARVPGEPTKLEIQSSLIGATSVSVRISDGKNPIDVTLTISPKNPLSGFRPALALNKVQCLLCHSQVKGNFVTSLGTDENRTTVGFHNSSSRDTENKGREFDYLLGEYTSYYSKSLFMTSFFDGTVYLPHRSLSSAAQSQAQTLISEALVPQTLVTNAPKIQPFDFSSASSDLFSMLKNPQTGGQYFFAMTQFQTSEYIKRISSWAGITKSIGRDSHIEEVQSIQISAPSEQILAAKVRSGESFSYYPQGKDSAALTNFNQRPVRRSLLSSGKMLWGNDPTRIMDCDGDLFVKGPVLLKDLRLRTKVGCRIHATGVIVISGSFADGSTNTQKKGYLLVDPTDSSNLELVSARAILMGLGYVNPTLGDHSDKVSPSKRLPYAGFPLPNGTLNDIELFVGNSADDSLVLDAGTDPAKPETTYGGFMAPRRLVGFDRLLINAPVIHSRYSGDFKGVVIGDFALWSLGQFKYEYDPVFDRVPVLPMIESSTYFQVDRCRSDQQLVRHPAFTECRAD